MYPYGYSSIIMQYSTDGNQSITGDYPNMVGECQIPILFKSIEESSSSDSFRLLSLFSGCGGMDIGFEGGFIAPRKSFKPDSDWIEKSIDEDWVLLKKNAFTTVFANDILPEAQAGWDKYMSRFGDRSDVYHLTSIVDLVKMHQQGVKIFPENIDIVTGGFPCQDFSVAGKRKGFDSMKDHEGKNRSADIPTEESRGKLYYWMKQVIDITTYTYSTLDFLDLLTRRLQFHFICFMSAITFHDTTLYKITFFPHPSYISFMLSYSERQLLNPCPKTSEASQIETKARSSCSFRKRFNITTCLGSKSVNNTGLT